jgi:hypothetical protein
MPTISTCPHCSQMVSIPQGWEATTLVRCPLCGAEYPLGAAMDLAPPELMPVETFDDAVSPGSEQPSNGADQEEVDIIRLESAGPESIPIQSQIKSPPIKSTSPAELSKPVAGLLSEPFFTAPAKPAGDSAVPPETTDEGTNVAAPPIVSSFLLQYGGGGENETGSSRNIAPEDAEDTAETSESPLDAEVYSLIAKHKEELEKESPNQAESSGLRRRSQGKPKSELRFFIGLALSGIVGLSIAYVSMAWIMGSRFPLPSPPRVLKPVLRFVLPDRIWGEQSQPHKNP